jgi:uncharacterized membrane protein YczE
MKEKSTWPIFWALLAVFVVVVAVMVSIAFVPAVERLFFAGGWFFIISGFLFFSLGVALLVQAVKGKIGGLTRKFLILTGAAATGIPISAILHNVIYGLFIYFFGEGFWERSGLGDEPFFFIIAVIVCPIGFLVGVVGSVVLYIKGRRR